jgi:peptide/nickel transport system substrate-binding protein
MVSWRTLIWYTKAFSGKYRRTLLLGLAIGVAVVWIFPRIIVYLPQRKAVQHIGRVGLFRFVDLPADIQEKVSVGLTSLDETGQPVPILAERWSTEEDGKVFRFLLKRGLRWQDGQEFVPDDVDYAFADVQTVRTENEVVFRLSNPYAPFPAVVSQPLFREERNRRLFFLTESRIIGLGEYRVLGVKYLQSGFVGELVMENNEQRLVYRFYPSEHDALVAFRHGKVDTLDQFPTVGELTAAERKRYRVEEDINLRQYVALFFNTSDPNLSREVRQALNYATHKPDQDPQRLRALSPISPLSWAYNATEEVNPFSYDFEKAVELYEKVNPAQPLKITLDTAVSLLDDAQAVAQDWKALGQEAEARCERTKALPMDPRKKRVDEEARQQTSCARFRIEADVRVVRDLQNIQAVLIGREVPPDPDQYTWWHSNQQMNISRYQNTRVDKLLEDARTETDQQKRKVMYFEFQRYLVEDVPAIFFFYVPQYRIARQGWL